MRSTALVAAVLTCIFALSASHVTVYANKVTKNKSTKVSLGVKAKALTAPAVTISVEAGENLTEIASDNNSTVARIFDANPSIVDPNLIYPQEVLIIPSANENFTDRPLPSDSPHAPTVSALAVNTPAPAEEVSAVTTSTQASNTASIASQPNATSSSSSIWYELAQCESGGNWSIDTGNGFYGGLQFTLSSWQSVGGVGYPNQASPAQQIAAAEQLQSMQGWGAWPVCSAKLGL